MKKTLINSVIFGAASLGLLVTAACSKGSDASRNWQPPAACYRGLNTNDCGLDIQDGSSWKTEIGFTTGQGPEVKTQVAVYYQFGKSGDRQAWQRIVTVDSGPRKGKRAMYESGEVVAVTPTYLDLTIDSNSCADEMMGLAAKPTPVRLYYARSGDRLRTSETQIVDIPADSGIGGYIGGVIIRGFADGIERAFQGLFSFGSARNWMEMGDGTWQKTDRLEAKDAGVIGCFVSIGNGFKPLPMPASGDAAVSTPNH